ncbi:magnesium ion transporter [Ceratobasidium sp. 394]|nr:magnesium ion transporter [Ceratobasidium sp. 394]
MLPALARRLAGCRRTRAALGPLVSVEALASAEARSSHPRPLNVWAHHGLSDGDDEAARSAILENALKGRQPTDLMLRCTVLDAEGNVKSVSGQFTKSDLCAEHRLNPRDLRKIDSRIPNLVPTILTRKEAILVNILHIRALVKADAVILFDSYGSVDSRLHSVFLYHLEHNLKQKTTSLPYEFRALESILVSVVSALEAEMVFTRHLVGGVLAELEDDIDRDKFKHLKVSIGTFGIGVGALVAGLFGMNLQSHFEDDAYAFYAISGIAVGVAGLVAMAGMRRCVLHD